MPPGKPRYTYLAKGRYWRFRHKLIGECSLPGSPGEARFHAAYAEKLGLVERLMLKEAPPRTSFAWLIAEYERSAEFRALADATQLDYLKTLDIIRRELGPEPFLHTTRAMIKAVRDDHATTARKANKIKQMVSRLYSWADENDLVPAGLNPTSGLKRLRRKGGEREITVWSDEEIELFILHAAPLLVTAVLLALYTGQRLSDLVRMSWTEFQGGTIRVRQSKTKSLLDIACHPTLRSHLEALPRASIQILTRGGKPMSANALAGALRREVERIPGMPKPRSMHGLRYAAASRMEEGGATVAEIDAVLGHRTFRMALKYASQRLRAKAGVSAMGRRNRGR